MLNHQNSQRYPNVGSNVIFTLIANNESVQLQPYRLGDVLPAGYTMCKQHDTALGGTFNIVPHGPLVR
jgi:hypothetical protein